ncbi:NUDIX domain-containing protein [Ideonella sp. DXS29W]|uniref:NUDIX domain-containing protein n=1 Tax=Ideonella lacteola TaxID=2984193 RepID=A0ABU9BKM4_9BURK
MRHRIAAGVLLEHDGKILLVRHLKAGAYDFWVAPGGGAEGQEDLRDAARREVREECGLLIEPLQIAYIEEFCQPGQRECKVWFTARWIGGTLDATAIEATREHIVEAAFLDRADFDGKTIFPPVLADGQYWRDQAAGFAFPKYLGVREMAFY